MTPTVRVQRTMDVDAAVAAIAAARAGAVTVLTMSAIAFWPAPAPLDYRLVGLMGAAGSIGLGLALGSPERPVVVIDGDGSLQMQMGVLAAIADAGPANLVHVVIDNAIYAVSGGQPTAGPVDWPAAMRAVGYPQAHEAATPDTLAQAIAAALTDRGGPVGIVARCRAQRPSSGTDALTSVRAAREAARLREGLSEVA